MQETKAKLERLETSLRSYGEEIAAIVALDVPVYMMKTARNIFINNIEFAESLDDGQLKFFKQKLAELGQQTAQQIRDTLAEPTLWLDAELDGSGKTLDAHAAANDVVKNISKVLGHFLSKEGIEADIEDYKTPARFIEGKYLPGIIEKFWQTHERYKALLAERQEQQAQDRRSIQIARWDQEA